MSVSGSHFGGHNQKGYVNFTAKIAERILNSGRNSIWGKLFQSHKWEIWEKSETTDEFGPEAIKRIRRRSSEKIPTSSAKMRKQLL